MKIRSISTFPALEWHVAIVAFIVGLIFLVPFDPNGRVTSVFTIIHGAYGRGTWGVMMVTAGLLRIFGLLNIVRDTRLRIVVRLITSIFCAGGWM